MIEFQGVSKAFAKQQVLEDVSFRIHPGERVGVVGPNGAGKSTVFALITGEITADAGELNRPKNQRLGLVHQQLHGHRQQGSILEYAENAIPELALIQTQLHELEHDLAQQNFSAEQRQRAVRRLGELQTQFEHLGGYDLRSRTEAALTGLGFAADMLQQPFRQFSGGWQMRAELVRTLVARPDVLLLDEPTNYLDLPAVEWLRDYLRDFNGTLLLISHDRYLLNTLTTATLEVAGGMVTRYNGNYDQYVQDRSQRHEQLEAAHRNQQRRREQLEGFITRFRAKSSKASQVQSRVKMLEKMEPLPMPREFVKPPRLRLAAPPPCSAEVIRLENAAISYDGSRFILRDVNLSIERGLRVAVVGLNGMGKTTLLRVIAGKLKLYAGSCQLGHKVMPGYLAQDYAEQMAPDHTVWQIARAAAPDRPEAEMRALLGSFSFSGEAIQKPVEVLSGGEKMRLALARLLLNPPNFLILDEPTTHLDIASREMLEQALQQFAGTICLVSHDVQFVRSVANTIVAVEAGLAKRYYGGYDYYRQKLQEQQQQLLQQSAPGSATDRNTAGSSGSSGGDGGDSGDSKTESKTDNKATKRLQAEQRQERYRKRKPLEKQVAKIEATLEVLSSESTALCAQLSATDATVDYAATSRRLHEVNSEIQRLTEQWEDLSLELEQLTE